MRLARTDGRAPARHWGPLAAVVRPFRYLRPLPVRLRRTPSPVWAAGGPGPSGAGQSHRHPPGRQPTARAPRGPPQLGTPHGRVAARRAMDWAKDKDDNDLRYNRLTEFRKKFLDPHGLTANQIDKFLNRFGDLEILKRYGYERPGYTDALNPDVWRELNQQRVMRAVEAYLIDHDAKPASMSKTKPEMIAAIEAKQKEIKFIQLWLEGWSYVTSSVVAGASARIASFFTDDQKKITAAAGAGYALAGVAGAVAPRVAKAYVQRRDEKANANANATSASRGAMIDEGRIVSTQPISPGSQARLTRAIENRMR